MKHRIISFVLALFALFFLCSCMDGLDNDLESDVCAKYTFYSGNPNDSDSYYSTNPASATAKYLIGSSISRSELPTASNGLTSFNSSSVDNSVKYWHYGYEVTGWCFYRNSNTGSTDVPSNVIVNDDIVESLTITPQPLEFYAEDWEAITYYVYFDANGGSGSTTLTCTYDKTYTIPSLSVSRSGYIFKGWGTSSDSSEVSYVEGNSFANLTGETGETVTFYAIWLPETVTISFDANGGSGTMSSVTLTYPNSAGTALTNTFTKTYYNFAGWNTASDGSGTLYADGYVFDASTWPTADLTLYAQWGWKISDIDTSGTVSINYYTSGDNLVLDVTSSNVTYSSYSWLLDEVSKSTTSTLTIPFSDLSTSSTSNHLVIFKGIDTTGKIYVAYFTFSYGN